MQDFLKCFTRKKGCVVFLNYILLTTIHVSVQEPLEGFYVVWL